MSTERRDTAAEKEPIELTPDVPAVRISNRGILVVLCLCSFSTLFNVRSIGPILVDISHEYGISVAQAGSLGAAYSLPAVFLSLLFGPLSDHHGRRRLMLLGLSLLVLTSLGSVLAPSFRFLLACRILAGVGAAAVVPSNFASFGDFFPYSERGRALAWQVAITTLAIVVGLPIGAILSGLLSWRWMFVLLAGMFMFVTTLVFIRLPSRTTVPRTEGAGLRHYRSAFFRILRNRSAMAALAASCTFGIFWQGWGTYNGAFFIQTFHIPTEALAPILTIHGLATILTSSISGRASDHFSKKNLAAIAMAGCGIIIAILTNASGVLWMAVAFNTLLAIPAGLRIVSANALLTELVPAARGTMMSMNTSIMEIGSMVGITVGGLLIDSTGSYNSLGSIYGLFVLVGSLIIYFLVTEVVDSPRLVPA